MSPTAPTPVPTTHRHAETLTIRMVVPADAEALNRLAQLDSTPTPPGEHTLVAEVGGELRAALPLDGGPAIADPFHRTAELVEMLDKRAGQLAAYPPRRAARRWRPLRTARLALVPRA
jgi:hypothetical protein